MSFHVNDLPNELLCSIFECLPGQLTTIKKVCTKWEECVVLMLHSEEALYELPRYSHQFNQTYKYEDKTRLSGENYVNFAFVDESNFEAFKSILINRKNIKRFDLGINIFTKNVLLTIANLCSNIQRISFEGLHFDKSKANFLSAFHKEYDDPEKQEQAKLDYFYLYQDEIEEFAKLIGPQLIYCNLYGCDVRLKRIILKQLKNIEVIIIDTNNFEEDKEFFRYLNLCQNLKILHWKRGSFQINVESCDEFHIFFNTTNFDRNFNYFHLTNEMVTTIQRIEHLIVDLKIFMQLKFEMNNLTELTLQVTEQVKYWPKYQMVFENLKKLNIKNFNRQDFDGISKMQFPNLETVLIKHFDFGKECSYTTSIINLFIDQIKHVKQLIVDDYIPNLQKFDSLESFTIKNKDYDLENLYLYKYKSYGCSECYFDVFPTLKSLKDIKISGFLPNLDYTFFKKLIKFKQDSNAKLTLNVNYHFFDRRIEEQLNKYKMQFDQTRELTKFIMKLFIIL